MKVFFLVQDAHKMMRTTAMNDDQIMKEIKDGSKKENIKSVYSFHVRQIFLDMLSSISFVYSFHTVTGNYTLGVFNNFH